MQELKNDTFKNPFIRNGDNSNYSGKRSDNKRFIECIRCGKQIKNDLKVIKNHEYYCINKELALREDEMAEQVPDYEYSGYDCAEDLSMSEKAIVNPISDEKADDNSNSFTGIIIIIGIVVGLIGAILIIYKILSMRNYFSSTIPKTVLNEQNLNAQSQKIVAPIPYSSLY